MTAESCGNCRYLSADSVCRRYPPTPLIVQQQSSIAPNARPNQPPVMIITAMQTSSAFPTMDPALGWCGEHKTKETIQ
jgi:hypothetical protein